MALYRRPDAFIHPDWIFEVKHDGFRSLAYVDGEHARLLSRRGKEYKSFGELAAWISRHLAIENAVLDGEIVCLDSEGRSQFNELIYRRGDPYFYAFDLLWLNGRDLRDLSLVKRKEMLREIIPAAPSRLLYNEHVSEQGQQLFDFACQHDLEGIVAKWKHGSYLPNSTATTWIAIPNPNYSQRRAGTHAAQAHRKPNTPHNTPKIRLLEPELLGVD